MHCGFGFGVVQVNPALEALGWDPPRFMGTAFQNAWINDTMWNAIVGWTGLDQYDEGNLVGQRFLDQLEATYGRRPEYCVPVVNRDLATVLLHAFADAHPLTPRGVKEALERVKMLPAASRCAGDPSVVREVDAARLDGRRLPRRSAARRRIRQLPPRRSIRPGVTTGGVVISRSGFLACPFGAQRCQERSQLARSRDSGDRPLEPGRPG